MCVVALAHLGLLFPGVFRLVWDEDVAVVVGGLSVLDPKIFGGDLFVGERGEFLDGWSVAECVARL